MANASSEEHNKQEHSISTIVSTLSKEKQVCMFDNFDVILSKRSTIDRILFPGL
jgi:hypothetical protein